ncbi:MAG: helix-turn-helix transcriptional regulator [Desulfobacterales bacterium]|nr:helix-turn-helix transcriptional regulator [Desulfobacterales bacterium]
MMKFKPDPYGSECPSRTIIGMIGDKWSLLVLPLLSEGPKRNGELMKRVEGISQKMLTQTLKNLAKNKLVHRHDYQEVPPRVDYRLTDLGKSLVKIVYRLDQWVIDHYYDIKGED